MEKKTRSDALSEKISPEQKFQLIDWLADHTYTEVIELAKADPPDGLGMTLSKAALSRFFQAHLTEIDLRRQAHILLASCEHEKHLLSEDGEITRNVLHQSAALRIQEQLCRKLAEPIETVAELRQLAAIAKTVTQLGVDLRHPNTIAERQSEIAELFASLKPSPRPPI